MFELPTNKDGTVKRTASQKRGLYSLSQTLERLNRNLYHKERYADHIPQMWHDIVKEYEEDKEKVTIRVDKSALKFFRSMGPKYQVRMNLVLRAFVQARAAGLLENMEKEVTFWEKHFCEERAEAVEHGLGMHWDQGCDLESGPFAPEDAKVPPWKRGA
jgi:uncharacterized protein (DUF4415 family)